MMLRWSDPAYGQHYREVGDHAVILGSWAWTDSPQLVRIVEATETRPPSPDAAGVACSNHDIPDFGEIYQAETVWHVTPIAQWRADRNSEPVFCFILEAGPRPIVHAILCTWGAFLNDQGDTIDQWGVYMNKKNAHMWAHLTSGHTADGDAKG